MHRSRFGRTVPFLAALALLLAGAAAAKRQPQVATAPLDEGKLIPSWFGDGMAFVEADEIDYLWVADGFSLEGASLHFEEWPDPEFLGEKAAERDEDDHRLARQMSSEMHRLFRDQWSSVFRNAEMSLDQGDIAVTGRVVDCSTGNTAAKVLVGFGAGSGNTTIDLKLTDKASGKVVMAMHHRVVSGTSWSTTDSKFSKWVKKLAKAAKEEGGFAGLYRSGKPVKD